MTNYPIGDFLIRVKNAALSHHELVEMQSVRVIKAVANALKDEGFLKDVEEKEGKLVIHLSYKKKEPVLSGLKLVSKPGLRIYMGKAQLARIKGHSVFIISTSKGIMSSNKAKKAKVGGEIIAEVW